MKLIALMPVRNEAWVLGLSARVALMWCDALVLLLHECDELRSVQIVQQLEHAEGERVRVLAEQGPWDEMRHRQRMLEEARKMGATHIALVDADEILTGNLVIPARGFDLYGFIPKCAGQILQLPGYNLRGSLDRYHSSGIWGKRWFSVAFADDPRLHWSGDKFHQREPTGAPLRNYRPIAQWQGGVMHLWGISERRLRAKHAWYKITERLRFPDKPVSAIDEMYSWAVCGLSQRDCPATWTFGTVPASWWAPYAHLMGYLDVEAEPWQEQACRDAIKQYGAGMFAGLDLFGVV